LDGGVDFDLVVDGAVDVSTTVVACVDWSTLITCRIAVTASKSSMPRFLGPTPKQRDQLNTTWKDVESSQAEQTSSARPARHAVVVNDNDGAHLHGAVKGDVDVDPSESLW